MKSLNGHQEKIDQSYEKLKYGITMEELVELIGILSCNAEILNSYTMTERQKIIIHDCNIIIGNDINLDLSHIIDDRWT